MQVPTILLVVTIEMYLALLIGAVILFLFLRKQKKLIRRQQEKLLELIAEIKKKPASTPAPPPQKTYKHYLNEHLEYTEQHFNHLVPNGDITSIEPGKGPTNQSIIALRHAFLRAEELATTEAAGSDHYWMLLQEALEPLIPTIPETAPPPEHNEPSPEYTEELETYKKRVENLEKFKKLFFDLEKQWNAAQANAHNYYLELSEMADEVGDTERFNQLLNNYHMVYNDLNHNFHNASLELAGHPIESKTINIVRSDPRAAEEIMKLRNVAADQYRVINNLQGKLDEAVSDEERNLLINELEQQLQRQIRFVQESETCIKLLEEELTHANEKIAEQEQRLDNEHLLDEENTRIKETLHSFTLESKDLLIDLDELEKENADLKNAQATYAAPSHNTHEKTDQALQEIQTNFHLLQKQYAELEEKYLELKFK